VLLSTWGASADDCSLLGKTDFFRLSVVDGEEHDLWTLVFIEETSTVVLKLNVRLGTHPEGTSTTILTCYRSIAIYARDLTTVKRA